MTIALVVETLLCIFLAIVLVYAVILNRHLSILRGSHQDVQTLMSLFDQAIQKAHQSLGNIKQNAVVVANQTEEQVKKAHTMCQELEFLIGRSEILVSELEGLVQKAEQDHSSSPLMRGVVKSSSDLSHTVEPLGPPSPVHALSAIQKLR